MHPLASRRAPELPSCAQNKHQKDNVSQSDIIPALQGGLAIYTLFSEHGRERNYPPSCFRKSGILPQDEVLLDSGSREHFVRLSIASAGRKVCQMQRIHARRGRYCSRVGGFRADGDFGIGCDGRQRNQKRGSQGTFGLDHRECHLRAPKPAFFRGPGKLAKD